jgi:hypothetical protein
MFELIPEIVNGVIQCTLPRCVVVGVATPELDSPVDDNGKVKETVKRFFLTVAMTDAEGSPVTQNLWLGNIWDHDQANAELEYWQTAIADRDADKLVLEDEILTTRNISAGQSPFWSFSARTRGVANVDTDLLALLG